MRLLNSIANFFYNRGFYSVNYDELNNFDINFKEITKFDLDRIKIEVLKLIECKSIQDKKARLIETQSLKYAYVDELMNDISKIISCDYKKTYFEAINNNWNFNYFLTDMSHIYKNALLINNRITANNNSEVIYSILVIKKFNGFYYLWNLLEDYEEYL
jgi:hypothetical protein